MSKKVKLLIIIIMLIAFLIVASVIIYNMNFALKFEKIQEFNGNVSSDEDIYWFSLRSDSYYGFFGEETLINLLADKDDIDEIDFDYDNYTYVITIGRELKSISYSYSDMKNRKFLFIPKQFVGNVVLDSKETDKLYIYRINKMDIDCDYHNRDAGVSFSD